MAGHSRTFEADYIGRREYKSSNQGIKKLHDDYRYIYYSSRLPIHPFWGKLFERDKLTGKVSPVSTNRLLIDFVKNCSSIRVRKKLPHTSKRQAIN
jgi:hypothetical protein